jgi:hypothetical protein
MNWIPSEQIMIKLIFGFTIGVVDFIPPENFMDINLKMSHHPLLSVEFGKQSVCQESNSSLDCY